MKNGRMVRRLLLICLIALVSVSPAMPHLWSVKQEIQAIELHMVFGWQVQPANSLISFSFGSNQDCLVAGENDLKIVHCQDQTRDVLWQSGEGWKVTEAISADLNRDGSNEIIMVVWRPYKPWPIDIFLPSGRRIEDFQDSNGNSCHLILIGWDGDEYRELWAGSSLIDPIFSIQTSDLDGDGNLELISLEGKYNSQNKTGNLTVWDWSGFGFRLRDRIKGSFSEYGIVSADKNVMIISN